MKFGVARRHAWLRTGGWAEKSSPNEREATLLSRKLDDCSRDIERLTKIIAASLSWPHATLVADQSEEPRHDLKTILAILGLSNADADLEHATSLANDTTSHLLLMPESGTTSLSQKTVMLSWNSKPEAANAAKAALSMLKSEETPTLLQ
ncbi:hypothetical protein [Brucella tritici]|uniref:hypothetical protein n=1 Tax=Brucella tritici TaxID=94626 RepID=UPI001590D9A2|nr:hypothetical protein [Brucella tritici]